MGSVVEIIKNEIVEFNEFDAQLAEFKSKYDGVVYDLTIPEDEKAARSDRLTIGKVISKLDSKHKELKAPLKAQTDLIDGERKRIKDDLLGVQNKIKEQIKLHEDAIREHDEMLQSWVDTIGNYLDPSLTDGDASYLSLQLESLKAIIVDDSYEHRKADATLAQVDAIKKLELMLADRIKYEKEQAELEKLRKEAQAREQKDRDDAIRKEAEAKAKDEAERNARAEADKVKADAEKAIQDANQREQAAKEESERVAKQAKEQAEKAANDERLRIENEQAEAKSKADALQAKEDAKKSKQAHRKKIHTAVKKDFIAAGFDSDTATAIVEALRDNKIERASIDY